LLVEQNGKLDEAQDLVLKALQKDPRQPDFEDTLGLVYLKKGRSEDAVLVSKNLVKKYPTNPLFLYHYGLALLESGQRAGAKTELETALSLRPSDEVRNGIEASLARLR
jgi:predicted Zn-dependent protease